MAHSTKMGSVRLVKLRLLVLLAMLSPMMSGCYSVREYRHRLVLTAPSCTDVAMVEWWDGAGDITEGSYLGCAAGSLLLYPFDVFVSALSSVECVWDDDVRLRGGIFGAALAIALPGITAFDGPRLAPWIHASEVSKARMKRVLKIVKSGRITELNVELEDLGIPMEKISRAEVFRYQSWLAPRH